MRWNRKSRLLLAKMVWERSVQIDGEIRRVSRGLDSYTRKRDLEIPAHFESLGFTRARADEWIFDPTHNHPALFKPRGAYLFFLVCTQDVMKVDKDLASKILVLGLP